MKTVRQLLKEADPLRDEPKAPETGAEFLRAAVAATAKSEARRASPRFRLVRLATVTVMLVGILFFGWRVWPRMAVETYAAVRFEVRLAEDQPGPGLREARINDGERLIYLHEEVVVSNGDISRTEVVPSSDGSEFWVGVRFNDPGAQRMRSATESHLGKRIAILIDDEVVMAPVVKSVVSDSAVISGRYTKAQAERIMNGLTN